MITLAAKRTLNLEAGNIEFATSLNGAIDVNTRGGALRIDSLHLSGTSLRSDNDLAVSAAGDIVLEAGGDGGTVRILSRFAVTNEVTRIHSGDIVLTASQSLRLETVGGDVVLGGLVLDGSTLASPSLTHDLLVHSAKGVRIHAESSHSVHMEGNRVNFAARNEISLEAPHINLRSISDINLSPQGGVVAVEGLELEGDSLRGTDLIKKLTMRSGRGLLFAAGPSHELRALSHDITLDADRGVVMSGKNRHTSLNSTPKL